MLSLFLDPMDVYNFFIFFFLNFIFQDIGQLCNKCPYTVYPESPLPQVFGLFRSMGLRHLPVVDKNGKVGAFQNKLLHNIKISFSNL